MLIEFLESSAKAVYLGISNLLVLAVLFFLFAALVNGKEVFQAIRRAFPNTLFNIALMSFNIIAVTPVIIAIAQYRRFLDISLIEPERWASVPQLIVILCAVFAGDFIGYWRHRFEHSRLLWPSHSVHHSDTQMTWLTLERFHPINRLTTFLLDSTFLMVLGFPPFAILANNLVRHYYGYFIHADIPWTYGKWGLVFVSPVMHRWHHAMDRSAYDTNFATVFSIFDRAFGTYRVPGICTVPLGAKQKGGGGFLNQLLYPFKPSSYIQAHESG